MMFFNTKGLLFFFVMNKCEVVRVMSMPIIILTFFSVVALPQTSHRC